MNKSDTYLKENLKNLLNFGNKDENPRPKYKDGTPAHTLFITQVFEEYDISKNEFPIPTLRNTAIKTAIKEILWIYQKQTNSLEVAKNLGINWWDEWNIGDGTIGQRYGATVKRYNLIDNLLENLKNDPFSRRHIMNLYQEKDLKETSGLYPCAFETIWSVRKIDNEFYLDLTLMQRSNDLIVANAINKIQYVALQLMIAGHLDYKIGKFCHFVQNVHIYDRHISAAKEIIEKDSLNIQPQLILKNKKNFYNYDINDFEIIGTENITKIKSELELAI